MKPNRIKKLRQQAFTDQGRLCYYCKFQMWEKDPIQFAHEHGIPARLAKHLQCTAEHLIAQQDGGRDTVENIVAACIWCNRVRHRGRPDHAPDPVLYKEKVSKFVMQGKWHPIASRMGARKIF